MGHTQGSGVPLTCLLSPPGPEPMVRTTLHSCKATAAISHPLTPPPHLPSVILPSAGPLVKDLLAGGHPEGWMYKGANDPCQPMTMGTGMWVPQCPGLQPLSPKETAVVGAGTGSPAAPSRKGRLPQLLGELSAAKHQQSALWEQAQLQRATPPKVVTLPGTAHTVWWGMEWIKV